MAARARPPLRSSHTRWSLIVCAGAVVATACALPATAMAGSVTLKGDRLEIKASKADNELVIGRVRDRIRIEERNADQRLRTTSSRCAREPARDDIARIECPASAVGEVSVRPRGGNDWVVIGRDQPESRGDRNNCRKSRLRAALTVALGGGNDVAELSAGDDEARGGAGHDLLMGCDGNDLVAGGRAGDRVSGDGGDDRVRGGDGPDWLVGCSYDPDDSNYPRGENGDDELRADEGDDFLYGCGGLDSYRAGAGDDDLNARDGNDEIADCGDGADVVYLDPEDARPGCETVTNCTTDNYPIGPDTGSPECFRRVAAPLGRAD